MKKLGILFSLTVLFSTGCQTASPEHFLSSLSSYEQRARAVIASMPVRVDTLTPLPSNHPHYNVIKEQNNRIAHANDNMRVSFFGGFDEIDTTMSMTFSDPEGYHPDRYVDFNLRTGELIECSTPTHSGLGGPLKWITNKQSTTKETHAEQSHGQRPSKPRF